MGFGKTYLILVFCESSEIVEAAITSLMKYFMEARKMASLGLTNEQRKMVMVLLCGAVLVVLNQTLLSPALPSIMEHLQVDATTVQWLTSAYALMEAVVIPLAAWFMGRFNTRVLFIGGMALFGAGSFVAAIAPVFAVLLLRRLLCLIRVAR